MGGLHEAGHDDDGRGFGAVHPSSSLRPAVPPEALAKRGRGGGIRTRDPLRPRQVRYQTALHPDTCFGEAVDSGLGGGPQGVCNYGATPTALRS
jgi:hypothetical protein